MEIESAFEADVAVLSSSNCETATTTAAASAPASGTTIYSLNVSRLATILECKLARNDVAENTVHIRQTGHVVIEADLTSAEAVDDNGTSDPSIVKQLVITSIVNSLKNVDCDLPPLKEICEASQVIIYLLKINKENIKG
jgi:hypothetical protein